MTHEQLHQCAMTCLFYNGFEVTKETEFDIYASRADEDVILSITDNHIYISHGEDSNTCKTLAEMLRDCLY